MAKKWAAKTVRAAVATAILPIPQRCNGVSWRWLLWFVVGSLLLRAKHTACWTCQLKREEVNLPIRSSVILGKAEKNK